jgi:hypothetical protein
VTRRTGSRIPPTYLAGWLFADLLLVLVLVVLGGEVPAAVATPVTPSPTGTASPGAPTASPSPSRRPGLDPDSTSLKFHVDATKIIDGDHQAIATLENDIAQAIKQYHGRSTALVIVWGSVADCGGCTSIDQGRSLKLAQVVAPLLPQVSSSFFPAYSEKIIRPYYDGQGAPGTLRLELFFLVQ